jgi:hypothetical protein
MASEAIAETLGRRAQIAAKIGLLVGILILFNCGVGWLADLFAFQMWPSRLDTAVFIVFAGAASYVILMVLPFMPGIEIGIMLMAMLGTGGIVLTYLCTVLALSLSFLLGRLLPPRYIASALGWFHLNRARDLVTNLAPLAPEERLRFLFERAPSKIVPRLLRHRYLVLGILFNLPGNAVIGDGGGIGLIAGMSRLFSFPKYLLLVSVAITPLPLLFFLRAVQQ